MLSFCKQKLENSKIVDGSKSLHFNGALINHAAIMRPKRQTVRKKADVERVLSAAGEGGGLHRVYSFAVLITMSVIEFNI